MSSPDEDLRDAFRLMYQDEHWSDEDSPDEVDAALEAPPRLTRAHFTAALDSLLVPGPSKRPRIYPARPVAPATYPSTAVPPPLPPAGAATYAPYSPLPYLARLRTLTPSTYPSLPAPLSPARAARAGWAAVSRHTLGCGTCGARLPVDGVADIPDRAVRDEVARRLARALESRHAPSCPWRTRASPESLHAQLRTLLHPPIGSSLGPLAQRLQLDCPVDRIAWRSPLDAAQLAHLVAALSRHVDSGDKENPVKLIPASAALALFGWYPHHADQPAHYLAPAPTGSTGSTGPTARTELVACRLCERRVGLWAYARALASAAGDRGAGAGGVDEGVGAGAGDEGRTFDVVDEHLAWCPLRDDWWAGLPLVGATDTGADAGAKVALAVSERPAKRWRRA